MFRLYSIRKEKIIMMIIILSNFFVWIIVGEGRRKNGLSEREREKRTRCADLPMREREGES